MGSAPSLVARQAHLVEWGDRMSTPDPWREELAGLIATGSARGFVTYEELATRLAGIEADPAELEAVLRTLESAGIEVTEEPRPVADVAEPAPVVPPAESDLPSALVAYERDLARVTPLDPETEATIAHVLGDALATLRDIYARAPFEARVIGLEGRGSSERAEVPAEEVSPAVLCECASRWQRDQPGLTLHRSWIDPQTRDHIHQSLKAIDEARARLVKGTMRLVFHLARRYQDRGVELLDLIQEGNAGLLRAAQRYDPTRGHAFASYATWWIRQAMARIVREQGKSFKVTQEVDADLRRINAARRRLAQSLQREPSSSELATELDLDEVTVDRLLSAAASPLRLDSPAGDNDDSTLEGFLEVGTKDRGFGDAMTSMLRGEIDHVLGTLESSERDLIRLRYGLHDGTARSLDEVAKMLKLTREKARKIEERALRKLRHPARRHRLDRLD